MKTVSLSGSPRENVGKKDAAALRRNGAVPCVVYGGENQIHFSLPQNEIRKLVYTPDIFRVELEIGGDKYSTIIQELQFHPLTEAVIHVDFLQLFEDKSVKIGMPVRLSGSPVGVRNGGKLRQNYRTLNLVGLPSAFPESIAIEIAELKIGESIRVSDIVIDGLVCLEPATAVIVGVKTARGSVDEEAEGEEVAEGEEEAAE
jgi:large subunit ribosomal protein L25